MWVSTNDIVEQEMEEDIFVVEGQESALGDAPMEDYIEVDQYLLTMEAEQDTQIVPLQENIPPIEDEVDSESDEVIVAVQVTASQALEAVKVLRKYFDFIKKSNETMSQLVYSSISRAIEPLKNIRFI